MMRNHVVWLFAVAIFLCTGLSEARAENVDWSDYIEPRPAKATPAPQPQKTAVKKRTAKVEKAKKRGKASKRSARKVRRR